MNNWKIHLMGLFLNVAFIFILSLIVSAFTEVFTHKFLFHSRKNFINQYLTRLWNYDIDTHIEHHEICKTSIQDNVIAENEYWVQRPSNVFSACIIVFLIEALFLFTIGFSVILILLAGLFLSFFFTFWYYYEDHFHVAMHKKSYYETHIKGTWQQAWFNYCKRLHIIHHRDDRYNYGFIFFPLGDLIMGTYKHTYKAVLDKKLKNSIRL